MTTNLMWRLVVRSIRPEENMIVNNRWTQRGVAFRVRQSKKSNRLFAVFACKCGTRDVIECTSVKSGHSKSCGCLKSELTTAKNTTHGMSRTSTYEIWSGMIKRCFDENNQAWDNYGGRGIHVCDRWLQFEKFFEDMGERPPKMSIERIDNNKGYEPSNCKWATSKAQGRNTRRNRILTANGKSMCIADWADATGIDYDVLSRRVCLGWADERVINTPKRMQ